MILDRRQKEKRGVASKSRLNLLVLPARLLQGLDMAVLIVISSQAPDHIATYVELLEAVTGLFHSLGRLPRPEQGELGLVIHPERSFGVTVIDALLLAVPGHTSVRGLSVLIYGEVPAGLQLHVVVERVGIVLGLETEGARSSAIYDAHRIGGDFLFIRYGGTLVCLLRLHYDEFALLRIVLALIFIRDAEPFGVAKRRASHQNSSKRLGHGLTKRIRH
jgi:hypothetical protein